LDFTKNKFLKLDLLRIQELTLFVAGLMDKNQELEGEILNKGLEEGKELLINQSNAQNLSAELEEMSENEVRDFFSSQRFLRFVSKLHISFISLFWSIV
jgi:hypothetical protein